MQVLDAHALMAYLEKESGYEKVRDIFTTAVEKDRNLLMTAVNWGEVYYIVAKEYDYHKADEMALMIQGLPIDIVPVDQELAKEAAMLKASYKMSYADCFAAALSRKKKAELITGDKEFKSVEDAVKINWI
jgi:ribonuclease VapC